MTASMRAAASTAVAPRTDGIQTPMTIRITGHHWPAGLQFATAGKPRLTSRKMPPIKIRTMAPNFDECVRMNSSAEMGLPGPGNCSQRGRDYAQAGLRMSISA